MRETTVREARCAHRTLKRSKRTGLTTCMDCGDKWRSDGARNIRLLDTFGIDTGLTDETR